MTAARRGVFTGLVLVGLVGVGSYVIHRMDYAPVVSVRIVGEFRHVDRDGLKEAIEKRLAGGFFGLDVDEVRGAALERPWVRDARVRRVWPNSLHVGLTERRAVARWGDDGLLEADGALFFPGEHALPEGLVRLAGPEGKHRDVLERYEVLRRVVEPVGRRIRQVSLTQRRSWHVVLDNGTRLILGNHPQPVIPARFMRAFQVVLGPKINQIDQIDLRYANGFAVRWREKPGG